MQRDQLIQAYQQYGPLLFYIARRFGVPDEVGDEIVQEAFLRLARHTEPLSTQSCKRFLVVATRNLLIDERKKHRPLPVAEVPDIEAEPADTYTIAEGRLNRVMEVWDQLKTARDFPIFQDYYQAGWTTEEIAQRRRLPAGTVRSKLHRFRDKFRQLLDGR